MFPITIKFQAFIPRSLGKPLRYYFQNHPQFNALVNKEAFVRKIENIGKKDFTWLPEPGNGLTQCYFATDNVEMSHHPSKHSTRLAIHLEIDPCKIGNMSSMDRIFKHKHGSDEVAINLQHSGLSHRVKAYIKKVPKLIDTSGTLIKTVHHYVGICNDIDIGRAKENPLDIKITNSKTSFRQMYDDTTTIKIAASAGYPFIKIISPNIDFKLEIQLYKNLGSVGCGSIDISVGGEHNMFPAYELLIGDRIAYTHNPSDYGYTGPSYGGLWKSKSFCAMDAIRLRDWEVRDLENAQRTGW